MARNWVQIPPKRGGRAPAKKTPPPFAKRGGLPGMDKMAIDNPSDTPAQEAAERKRGIRT